MYSSNLIVHKVEDQIEQIIIDSLIIKEFEEMLRELKGLSISRTNPLNIIVEHGFAAMA